MVYMVGNTDWFVEWLNANQIFVVYMVDWFEAHSNYIKSMYVCIYIYIVIGNATWLDHIWFDQFGSQPFFFAKKTVETESLGPQKWSESQFSWGKWALTIGCGENMGKPHFEQICQGIQGHGVPGIFIQWTVDNDFVWSSWCVLTLCYWKPNMPGKARGQCKT
jgi:hypothetical protein